MRKDYTDITVVLDRSGSMSSIASEMESGYNSFLEDQKKQPGVLKLSLTQFDTMSIDRVYEALDIACVPKLQLVPRGGTPLLDALGKTIVETGERLKRMPHDDRPAKVLVIVITDGYENASREWTKEKIKTLVEQQVKDYAWDFMYLGANVDAFAEAGALGFAQASSVSYGANAGGAAAAFASVTRSVSSYRAADDKAVATQDMAFTDEERKKLDSTI